MTPPLSILTLSIIGLFATVTLLFTLRLFFLLFCGPGQSTPERPVLATIPRVGDNWSLPSKGHVLVSSRRSKTDGDMVEAEFTVKVHCTREAWLKSQEPK